MRRTENLQTPVGEKPPFNKITHAWICLVCNYSRDKYRRYQVFGRIAETRGYTSRIPNESWGVARRSKFQEQNAEEKRNGNNENTSEHIGGINHRRIMTETMNNETIFVCGYCMDGRNYKKEINANINRTHQESKTKNPNVPIPHKLSAT